MKSNTLKKTLGAAGILCAALLSVAPVSASYPEKPVTLVSAFPPGGGTDILARMLAPKLSEVFKQQFIVENKAGASGNIASALVARSKPDGYTLLVHNNTITLSASIGSKLNYDVQKDLIPLGMVASTPVAIGVHPSVPARTFPELIEYVRKNPGKISFSSCGNGTAMHFAGVQIASTAKIDWQHVPYKGCGPAMTDALGGQVPVIFTTITNITPQAAAGKLRILAVASAKRVPFHPNVPAVAEFPGFAGFDFDVWMGVFAPAGTPKDLVAKLESEITKFAEAPETKEAMATRLFAPYVGNAKAMEKQIASDLTIFRKLAAEFNVTAD